MDIFFKKFKGDYTIMQTQQSTGFDYAKSFYEEEAQLHPLSASYFNRRVETIQKMSESEQKLHNLMQETFEESEDYKVECEVKLYGPNQFKEGVEESIHIGLKKLIEEGIEALITIGIEGAIKTFAQEILQEGEIETFNESNVDILFKKCMNTFTIRMPEVERFSQETNVYCQSAECRNSLNRVVFLVETITVKKSDTDAALAQFHKIFFLGNPGYREAHEVSVEDGEENILLAHDYENYHGTQINKSWDLHKNNKALTFSIFKGKEMVTDIAWASFDYTKSEEEVPQSQYWSDVPATMEIPQKAKELVKATRRASMATFQEQEMLLKQDFEESSILQQLKSAPNWSEQAKMMIAKGNETIEEVPDLEDLGTTFTQRK